MNVKESVELLERAANELSVLIAAYNFRLKRAITSQTEDEPDYMDMQTCHELQVMANQVGEVPEWISVNDHMPEEKGYYLVLFDALMGAKQEVVMLETHHRKRWISNTHSWDDHEGLATHWMPLPELPVNSH